MYTNSKKNIDNFVLDRYVHEEWRMGATLCRLYPFFFYGNVGASLMNMVAITLNRYSVAVHPPPAAAHAHQLLILTAAHASQLLNSRI
jgi:hypothetical protein